MNDPIRTQINSKIMIFFIKKKVGIVSGEERDVNNKLL